MKLCEEFPLADASAMAWGGFNCELALEVTGADIFYDREAWPGGFGCDSPSTWPALTSPVELCMASSACSGSPLWEHVALETLGLA